MIQHVMYMEATPSHMIQHVIYMDATQHVIYMDPTPSHTPLIQHLSYNPSHTPLIQPLSHPSHTRPASHDALVPYDGISRIGHDSMPWLIHLGKRLSTCVPWLMCAMTHVCHDSCVPWLMCAITHVCHDSCVPWLVHMSDKAYAHMHDMHHWQLWYDAYMCAIIRVIWRMDVWHSRCDITHQCLSHDSLRPRKAYPYVWQDSGICVTRFRYMCDRCQGVSYVLSRCIMSHTHTRTHTHTPKNGQIALLSESIVM